MLLIQVMGRKRSNLCRSLFATATAAMAIAALGNPGSAFAAATIGTNLGNAANTNMFGCNNACTAVNRILLSDVAPQGLTSPVNGTVTSWRFNDTFANNHISLRVLREVDNGVFTGISTSAAQTSVIGTNGPFATSLPIRAGDSVGLEADSGGGGFLNNATPADFLDEFWFPPLADGETRSGTGENHEVLVQAAVEPTNIFTISGVLARNKKKGTATVGVGPFPNPGSLAITPGQGANLAETAVSKTVTAGQTVKFLVRAVGKKRKKLNKKGKVKVTATFTYTPNFGAPSTPTTKIKLKKKPRRH